MTSSRHKYLIVYQSHKVTSNVSITYLHFATLSNHRFMWMMGVSMALSFEAMAKKDVSSSQLWRKCIQRTVTLFGIGMFLANGYELSTWRIPGIIIFL